MFTVNGSVAGAPLVYVMFAAILLLNTWAYTKVNLKYGPVIDTFTYVFVLLLSVFALHEKLTGWKLFGNVLIIAGNLVADVLYSVIDPRIRVE